MWYRSALGERQSVALKASGPEHHLLLRALLLWVLLMVAVGAGCKRTADSKVPRDDKQLVLAYFSWVRRVTNEDRADASGKSAQEDADGSGLQELIGERGDVILPVLLSCYAQLDKSMQATVLGPAYWPLATQRGLSFVATELRGLDSKSLHAASTLGWYRYEKARGKIRELYRRAMEDARTSAGYNKVHSLRPDLIRLGDTDALLDAVEGVIRAERGQWAYRRGFEYVSDIIDNKEVIWAGPVLRWFVTYARFGQQASHGFSLCRSFGLTDALGESISIDSIRVLRKWAKSYRGKEARYSSWLALGTMAKEHRRYALALNCFWRASLLKPRERVPKDEIDALLSNKNTATKASAALRTRRDQDAQQLLDYIRRARPFSSGP